MTARELASELLRHRFTRDVSTGAEVLEGLAGFQTDAVQRLLGAIEHHGGALLADSVGLGKTHVGAAVVRHAIGRGEAAGVIVPTSLLRQWRRALRGADRVTFTTHATLSRGGAPALARAALLLVDEAHAFRNPATRRYAALARATAGRRLLLITATPVNNSLRDLYWLLRLFAQDAAFAHVGVPDLFSCFRAAERTGRMTGIAAVLGEVAVRRTRDLVGDIPGQRGVDADALRFPRRAEPREIAYAVDAVAQRELLGCIESLRLAPWTCCGPPTTSLLLRLVLLKRLESSRAAFGASAARLLATLRDFRSALAAGRLLTPAEQRLRRANAREQLAFDDLLLRPLPKHIDAAGLDADAAHDASLLEDALRRLRDAGPDAKTTALAALLAAFGGRPAVVFSEYRETAEHLWRALGGEHRAALIHGSGAWLGRSPATRRAVVERFAPLANGVPPPHPREAVHLLIATDVIAEGLNLQDAADVVSCDLPWNPVRLLQRVGRVDRLGSRHDEVRAWYFRPDHELDEVLALMQRIRAKIAAIRSSIGEEARVLAADGGGKQNSGRRRLRPHTPRRIAEDAFALEERLRHALARSGAGGGGALDGTPLGGGGSSPGSRGRPEGRPGRAKPPALLVLPRPTAAGLESADAVLFFDVAGRQRAVVAAGGRFREDPRTAAAVLLAALEVDAAGAGESDRRMVAGAIRWLTRPPAPAHRPPRLRRLRGRLYSLLQERPGGPTVAECERAERLAARLAGPLTVAEELAIRREAGRDFDALADGIERALRAAGRGADPEGSGSPGPRVAGESPRPAREGSDARRPEPRFLGGFLLRGG